MTKERTDTFKWRELGFQAVFLMLLLAFAFPGTFLRGEAIIPAGLLYETPPWKDYKPAHVQVPRNWLTVEVLEQPNKHHMLPQRIMRGGEWPLWNPLEFAGVPMLANYQSGVFYPLCLVYAIFGHYFAATVHILLRLWLCGMTAYICGRYLRLGVAASRFLSVGWMLGGYNLVWCYYPEPDIGAWGPLLFVSVEVLLDGRYRRGFFAMAFAATMLLIAGQPENAFSMSLGCGLYFFLRLAVERRWGRNLWVPIGLAGGAWALAILATAIQWAPFFEYMFNSHTYLLRPEEHGGKHFLPHGGHLALWIARFWGTTAEGTYWGTMDPEFALGTNSTYMGMVYAGVAVWVAVFLLTVRGSLSKQRARVFCLVVSGLFSLLMAFKLAIVQPVQELPLFNAMWRCYYINFAKFALPLLAAIGIHGWFSRPRRAREFLVPSILLVILGGYLFGCYRFFSGLLSAYGVDLYVWRQLELAAMLALLSVILLLLHCFRVRPRPLAALLTVVLAFDLVFAVRGLHPTTPPDAVFPDTKLTTWLADQEKPCRVSIVSSNTIRPTLMYPYGIEDHWGHDGIYPERIVTFYGRLGSGIWNAVEPVCAIRYYLHNPEREFTFPHDDPGRFRLAETLDGIEVYENLRAFSRAFLVGQLEVIPDKEALFERMADPGYDPGRVIVAGQGPAGSLPSVVGDKLGNAVVVERTANSVKVLVEASQDCYLVLADAYFPGWEAFIDDNPVEIFPAYYAFRGIVVPADEHTVTFRYYPWSFRIGLALSVLGLLIGAALGIAVAVRQRRRPTLC